MIELKNLFVILYFIMYIINTMYTIKKIGVAKFIFHPINIFSLYLLLFFMMPIYLDFYYIPSSLEYMSSNVDEHIFLITTIIVITYLIISIINIFMLNKLNFSFMTKKQVYNNYYGISLEVFIILYLFLLYCILFFMIYSMGGLTALTNNFAEFTIKARNGNTLILMIIYTAELLPVAYILLSRRKNKLFLFFITLFSMLIVTIVGARILTLSIIIGLSIAILASNKKIKLTKFLKLGMVFLIFFILGSLVRNSDSNSYSLTFEEKILTLKIYLFNNSDQLFTSLYTIDKIKNNQIEFQYGKTVIDAFYFFIPTSIWADKPRSYYPSRLVYKEIIEAGVENNTKQTINFGMIARPYLDFGILGIFVLNIILYLFLSKLYMRIVFFSEKMSSLYKFKSIYIYSHIVQIYILGVLSHVISIFLFNIIFISMVYYIFLAFNSILNRKLV